MSTFQELFTTLHAKLVKATGSLGGGATDGKVLVLRHVGAKSGKVRETPLMFVHHDGGYAIAASAAGAPKHPGWYHNLRANPETTINVAKQDIPVRARVLDDDERDVVWSKFKTLGDAWERYETRTARTIPIVLMEPV